MRQGRERFRRRSSLPDGNTWTPRSTDKEQWIGKTVTLKWGLTNSSNNISAYLMKQFGPEAMADMMRRMGIQSHIDEVPALCVGPADLSLWEMVAAYNTFPSRGVYIEPMFVTRIEDNQGNVISEFTNRKREAIGENTAYLMVNLMGRRGAGRNRQQAPLPLQTDGRDRRKDRNHQR